ncbi:MAG: TonB family protein [Betaproteobacteria bacterium]|nr:TonB family protein [Betaproteobacteria bacterium]
MPRRSPRPPSRAPRLRKPRAAARRPPAAAAAPAAVPPAPPSAVPIRGRAPGATSAKPPATGVRSARAVVRPLTAVEPAPAPSTAPAAQPRARLHPAGALPPARIPPEALAAPRDRRLIAWAAVLSVSVHLVVLAIHFAPADLSRMFDRGPPLEIALVNAKTKDKPQKADILAQSNLDGGGNTDADRRAKTPLPVLPKDTPREDIALASERVQTLERQTQELFTQLKSVPSLAAQPKPTENAERTDSPTANELMQRTMEAMRLEAQIAKDMDAYQKRPKRRFLGARAEEYRFARYVEDWRLKVERIGNMNYPEAARQQKLYGSLLITVSIRSDGTLENVEINRSSGHRVLDAAAVRVVEMSAPYAAFPPDIRRDTDILHITRTWTFTKADELVSRSRSQAQERGGGASGPTPGASARPDKCSLGVGPTPPRRRSPTLRRSSPALDARPPEAPTPLPTANGQLTPDS